MTGIVINQLEVRLNKYNVNLVCIEYSEETFQELVDNYKDWCFYRSGINIFGWPLSVSSETLPDTYQTVKVDFKQLPFIFSSIINQSLIKFFEANDYDIYRQKYSSIWSVELKQEEKIEFNGLTLYPYMDFCLHVHHSTRLNESVITISLRKRYKPVFTLTEEELEEKHIDPREWDRDDEDNIIATRENIEEFLIATNASDEYYAKLKSFYTDKVGYDSFVQFKESFDKIKDRLFLPDNLKLEELKINNIPNAHFEWQNIHKPTYYFYNERTKGGLYDQAVADLKPYSYDLFSTKDIKIVLLTPEEYEGSAEGFLVKVKNNLQSIFHIEKVNSTIITFNSQSGGYLETLKDEKIDGADLVVIVVSEKDKKIPVPESPYYSTKAKLLNRKIPTQDITIENIRKNNMFIERNIVLNIYSKIGGTAWTIEKEERDKVELIIGIGSTMDHSKNRIIGFANVFDHNGTYLVGECSQISTKEDYQENLELHIKSSIQSIIDKRSVNKQVPFRLIFHLYKEAGKKTEIMAIENALKQFEEYNIQYAIVHLGRNHNLRIYSNEGKNDVFKGTYIQLSKYSALLHFGGQASIPIYIRLDKRSTYKDLYAVSKQVLFFAHLSHRNFKPANIPVTIKYPTLMAKLLTDLKQIPGWDYDQIDKLKETLWFI